MIFYAVPSDAFTFKIWFKICGIKIGAVKFF